MSSKRPIRVLHVIDTLVGGGCERWVWDLVRLSDPSQAVHRVVTVQPEDRGFVYADRLRRAGVYGDPRNGHGKADPTPPLPALFSADRILMEAVAFRPDVVHAHVFRGFSFGLILKALSSRPLVYSVPALFSQIIRVRCGWVLKLYRRFHPHVDRFFTAYPSELFPLGIAGEKVALLQGGVDIQAVTRCRSEREHHRSRIREMLKIPQDALLVLSVGRLHEEKGHGYAIEALRLLRQRFRNLHWIILGEGHLRGILEANACKHGVRPFVHLPGFMEDPLPFYAAADLYARTCIYEGENLSSYQAMAMGLPVVGFDTGASTDLIPKVGHGLLVPNRNAEALAGAIGKILTLPDTGQALGKRGLAYAQAHLDIRDIVRSFAETYRALSRQNRKDPSGIRPIAPVLSAEVLAKALAIAGEFIAEHPALIEEYAAVFSLALAMGHETLGRRAMADAFRGWPCGPWLPARLGVAWLRFGRPELAEQAFREALARDPLHLEARRGLAAAARAKGRYDEAARQYREALKHHPHAAALWVDMGHLAVEMGDPATARTAFQFALEQDPFLREAQEALAAVPPPSRMPRSQKTPRAFHASLRPRDVFIVTYPKSGTHWLRFFLAAVLIQKAPETKSMPLTWDSLNRCVPNVHDWYAMDRPLSEYADRPDPRIFAMHIPCDPALPKVVYVVRDPRDVMVSFYHHHRRTDPSFRMTLEEFILRNDTWCGDWGEHVAGWLAHARSRRVLVLRYEDLYSDLYLTRNGYPEFRKILDFCGLRVNDEELRQALEISTFENMARLEAAACGNGSRKGTGEGNSRIPIVRRGKVGGWREELSPDLVNILNQRYAELLRILGYGEEVDVSSKHA